MKKTFILLLFSALVTGAYAQSAESITKMLNADSVTIGQACYFTGVYLGLISDDDSESVATDKLQSDGYAALSWESDKPITMDKFSLLCSKTWNISESLLYKITNSPRYAFKQLKALNLIPSDSNPDQKITGQEALNIYTQCIEEYSPKENVKDSSKEDTKKSQKDSPKKGE